MTMNPLAMTSKAFSIGFAALFFLFLVGCSSEENEEAVEEKVLKNDTIIAYVERSVSKQVASNTEIFSQKTSGASRSPLEIVTPYAFSLGAKLMVRSGLDVNATQEEILTDYFGADEYDVKDLNVSPNGEQLLFAARGANFHPTDSTWNIFSYQFESKQLRRIISSDFIANSGQDTNPTFTADGKIIFSSDRNAGNPLHPRENIELVGDLCRVVDPAERPSLLHSMTTEGDSIIQLTYGRFNHDINPTHLKDGRIAFVRWERSYQPLETCEANGQINIDSYLYPKGLKQPPAWNNEIKCAYSKQKLSRSVFVTSHYKLLTITSDGESMEQLYNTITTESSEEAFIAIDQIFQAENGNLFSLIRHQYNRTLGGAVVELEPSHQIKPDTVFAEMSPRSLTFTETNLYPGQLSDNGWFSAFWPYRDGSSRLLLSWSQCTLIKDGINSFCDSSTDTEGELEVKYGIWVFDPLTNSRTPIIRAENDRVFTELAMSQAHQSEDLSLTSFDSGFIDNPDATQILCNFPNNIPLAIAGADQSGDAGDIFALDGSNSSDPDNDPLTYLWSITSAPANSSAMLSDVTLVNPTIETDFVGQYTIQLVVNDGEMDSLPDSLNVTVVTQNRKPVANAGEDQSTMLGNIIGLDGSKSYDPDGNLVTYTWIIASRPNGSQSELEEADTDTPKITPDVAGSYVVQLIVNDGVFDSAPDTVNILVGAPINNKPIANAGADQSGDIEQRISLNGLASRDPDGDNLFYSWNFIAVPAGSSTPLMGNSTATPNFTADVEGNYIVQLIVNDGQVDSEADIVSINIINSNIAPVANAGNDQQIRVNETATLNGAASSDPDGDALSYQWALISQPDNLVLLNATSTQPSFTPTQAGNYVAQLIVNDGKTDSNPDTVMIVVIEPNSKPTADAGVDQSIDVDQTISLDGSRSSDPDNDPLTYRWTVGTQPEGASVIILNSDKVNPTFTAVLAGEYSFQLVVNDGYEDSDRDTVMITVNQVGGQPVANAGDDQSGEIGQRWNLDGSASSDPDGDTLTYQWSLLTAPDASFTTLSDATAVSPQMDIDVAGEYLVQLIVNDGNTDSLPDTVIFIAEEINNAPIANAGSDQIFVLSQTVQLDGSASTDVDGDRLTYQWTIISPAETDVVLSDPTAVSPTLTPDTVLDYVIELVVYDGKTYSQSDTVVLVHENIAPIADAGIDQISNVGTAVQLDGSASHDLNGTPLNYAWRIVSKPGESGAEISDTALVRPTILIDVDGVYVLELIVDDGYLASEPDTMIINTLENTAPVANAGDDQLIQVGATNQLDGSASFDVNGDSISYRWVLIHQPESSQAELTDANSIAPSLEIDVAGEYVAQLIVNDGILDSAPDTVFLSNENIRPIAIAGEDQTVDSGEQVSLDGSASYDPDGDQISHQWTVTAEPEGSNIILSDSQAVSPHFTAELEGIYVLQLIVDDGAIQSYADSVAIDVSGEPDVCEVSNDTMRVLPFIIRDFKSSHPDFEYRIGVDYGIVNIDLGDDGLPVYAYPDGTRSKTTTGEDNFNQWYRDVEDVNINIPKTLTVSREADSTLWEYSNDSFFPIDDEGWGNTGMTSVDHNYHFSLEMHLEFDYKGGEAFTFRGDDDLWLFINGKLVIDIGGVHSKLEKTVDMDAVAESIGIEPGGRYSFDLFFAERHTVRSNFMFQTNMDLECVSPE